MKTSTLNGWTEANIGSIFEFIYGQSLPEKNRSGKGFPVYGSNGIVGFHHIPLSSGETIVIGRKGSVGEVNFSSIPCHPIDTTYYIDNFHGMPMKYWYYVLINARLGDLNKATAIPGLNREDAYGVRVPIAPLNEQKRIANKLDALLERVDTCSKHLESVPEILRRFRQSVLAVATSGRLTKEWREKRRISIDSWITRKGEDVFPFITSGSRGWAAYYAKTGAKFIRIGNLNHDTIDLDLTELQHVNPPDNSEGKRTRIELGDILISITADLGMVALIRENIGEAYINQHICLARQSGEYSGAFLAYYLASPTGLAQFVTSQRGMTKLGLTLEDIKAFSFQIPNIEEQREIVHQVEILFNYADRLESRYQAACSLVKNLTPSLLAKAFRGELVPQDPNDEPGSILLEHIRAMRASIPAKSPISRRSTNMSKDIYKKTGQIDIVQALHEAGRDLSGAELFSVAGYPPDADSEVVESFFVAIRNAISANLIVKDRHGNEDWFSLNTFSDRS